MPPPTDPTRTAAVRAVMTQLLIARQTRGITQEQLAQTMGTTIASISGWENARVDPLLSSVVAYARAVELDTIHIDL